MFKIQNLSCETIDYFADSAAILNRKVLWGIPGGEA